MEAGLLRAFRRGDPDALESVYLEHVGEVQGWVRHALSKMGRLTASDLADLVQDVFVRAFSDSARSSYDGLREYVPFLITIARNRFVDWARRSGREIPGSDFLEGAIDRGATADGGGDEASPFEPATVALVQSYLQSLPDELKRIHHQRFVLATPQRQAADALGISRQSLRTLEKKLIVGLHARLREAGVDETSNPALPAVRSSQGGRDA
jgi:RNA polymerase sigma-70 factor (ECF subfamily)